MQKYFTILKKVMLFQNIKQEDMPSLLRCLHANVQHYSKAAFLLVAGDAVTNVGIVLKGQAHVLREDINGNQLIVTELQTGDLFAETFACIQTEYCPVTVAAMTDCTVLWLDYRRVIMPCTNLCSHHAELVGNMLRQLAMKNLKLNSRLEVLSKRSIRERLLVYLEMQAEKMGSREFSIPFNRNELADYLCIDRSAMSRELSNLRREGVLHFEKNRFKLLVK